MIRITKYFVLTLFTAFLLSPVGQAHAQDGLPSLPAPIQNLVDEGAQIRYIGKEHGVDGWIAIKNGQEQYFYVLPGGKAFLSGILFDDTGRTVTIDQVRRLRDGGDALLDTLTADFSDPSITAQSNNFEFKSPAERMFYDIENSNWVALGQPGAPALYSFIDPQCPHCHAFVNDLREGLLQNGQVQLRMIPVGFKEETQAQAAFLLATPDPQERWIRHMDGDETALPARAEINTQGVQRNLALMQAWKFSVTPMLVYRAKDGSVKLLRGRPQDLDALINDIGVTG